MSRLLTAFAALCLAALGLLLVLLRRGRGAGLEGEVMTRVLARTTDGRLDAAGAVVSLADPRQALLLCAATALGALVVAAPPRAVTVVGVLLVAQLAGLALGDCCPRVVVAEQGPLLATAPSNHTVLSASVAAALVLCAPRVLRGLVAAGAAAFALGVPVGLLLLGSHTPLDVLAGWLLTAGVLALALALEGRLRTALPPRWGPLPLRTVPAVLVLTPAVAGVVLWLLSRDPAGVRRLAGLAEARPDFVLLFGLLVTGVFFVAQATVRR